MGDGSVGGRAPIRRRGVLSALVAFALGASTVAVSPLAPLSGTASAVGATILVPGDHATIQAAIDAAADGDTVLVSPGTYGPITINGKNIVLASEFHTTGDPAHISSTIIDGSGASEAILVSNTTAPQMKIIGFTIQGAGGDGMKTADAHLEFLDNVVKLNGTDGIDYESSGSGSSGGVIRNSVFELNGDDGIDLDNTIDIVIEDTIIRNNGQDGIEIRLQGYTGPTVDVIVQRNDIHDNEGDGIQLIGYSEPSDRNFVFERNLFVGNLQAGVGMMDKQETNEDFRGAPLPDPVLVINNTFDSNAWAFTGGANTKFVNNAVMNSTLGGLKNLVGSSLVSHTGFWQNNLDTQNSNLGAGLVFADPMMNPDHTLTSSSPYIDAGDPTCLHPDTTICDIGRYEFGGGGPDVTDPTVTLLTPLEGASFAPGQVVNADYTCTDAGSGIASCAGDVADGSPIDTSTLGLHSFTVVGTDNATNTTTVSHNYTVVAPAVGLAVDAVSSTSGGGSSLVFPHTVSGADRLLLVGVSINNDNLETVSSVTHGGVPLSLVGAATDSDDARVEIWALVNPAEGTADVVVDFSAALTHNAVAGAVSFTGVDQSTPLGPFSGANATSSAASVSVPSDADELVFGVVSCETCSSLSFDPPATEHWNHIEGGGKQIGAGGVTDGATPSVTVDVSLGVSDHWAIGAVSISPVAPPPGFPPQADPDSAGTDEDVPVTIDVAANDSDIDGNLDRSTVQTMAGPGSGTTVDHDNGTITYTPSLHSNGTDTFTYEICDTTALCDTTLVTVVVAPTPDPPTAAALSVATSIDTPIVIDVATASADPDGDLDPASVATRSGPGSGSTTDHPNGTITYTPAAGTIGPDSFTYEICDTTPTCDTAVVDITVQPAVPLNGLVQSGFRIRTGDTAGLNVDADWAAPFNVGAPAPMETIFRIRFEIAETDGNAYSGGFGLQYRRNLGPWTNVVVAPDDSTARAVVEAEIWNSSQFANGDATTDLLAGSAEPFQTGDGLISNPSPSISLDQQHTELEWSLRIRKFHDTGTNLTGDTFEFRVVESSGTPLDAYAAPAVVTLFHPPGLIGGCYVESPSRIGPYADSNGNLYYVTEPTEFNNRMMMLKSTDGGATWLEVDAAGHPLKPDLEGVDIRQVGDTLHIAHAKSGEILYNVFNMSGASTSPDTWVIVDETADSGFSQPDQAVAVEVLSDGRVRVFYSAVTAGNNAIRYTTRSTGGTWDSPSVIDPEGVDWRWAATVRADRGANLDRIFIFYNEHSSGASYMRTLDADDSLSARSPIQVLDTGGGTQKPILPPVYFNDAGTDKVLVVYRKADGFLYSKLVTGTTVGAEAQASDQVADNDRGASKQPVADLAAHDGVAVLLYADATTFDLWMDSTSMSSVSWGADTEIIDAIRTNWVRGTIFEHGGETVYGFGYEDHDVPVAGYAGGHIRYGEVAIVTPPVGPTADAGVDVLVGDTDNSGAESVTLDGSGSTAGDAPIASYEWFEGASSLGTGVTLPVPLTVGEHTIRLDVVDDDGLTSSDEVVVTVAAAVGPTADAGGDRTVFDVDLGGDESVTLDGSASTVGDSAIVTYEWFEGASLGIGMTLPVVLALGSHTIRLDVTDANGLTSSDEIVITVDQNLLPIADAGPDDTVVDDDGNGTATVTLDGSGSTDPDGSISLHEWFEGGSSLGTGVTLPVVLAVGVHTIELMVTDNEGATGIDEVVIDVDGPPLAAAGPDQVTRDTDNSGGESVTLDGSGSTDPDGLITRYEWFEGASSLGTGKTLTVNLPVGPHTIRLEVTDDDGHPGSDESVVTVDPPLGPSADAGPDQTLIDADSSGGELVTLDGSGSTAGDSPIALYEWFEGSSSLGTGVSLPVTLPVGVHAIRLDVTDGYESSSSDQTVVTVGPSGVGVDSVSSTSGGGSSLVVSHMVSGSSGLLLVGVSINNDNFETVSSVTYGGVPLSFVGAATDNDDARVEIWSLVAPAVGTADVVVSFSASLTHNAVVGAVSFTGVDQSDPLGLFSGAGGTSGSASVSVPSAVDDVVFGVVSCETCGSLGLDPPATEHWNHVEGAGKQIGAGGVSDGAGPSVGVSAGLGVSDHWAMGAVSVKAAGPPPGASPEADPDSANTDEDMPVTIDVAANDSDGNLDPATVQTVSAPGSGTTVDNSNGTITYIPNLHSNGPDTFTYEICDTTALCATALVTVTVAPLPDPPMAAEMSVFIQIDTPIVIDVATASTDPDGDLDPTSVSTAGPGTGSTTDNPNGDDHLHPRIGRGGPRHLHLRDLRRHRHL